MSYIGQISDIIFISHPHNIMVVSRLNALELEKGNKKAMSKKQKGFEKDPLDL